MVQAPVKKKQKTNKQKKKKKTNEITTKQTQYAPPYSLKLGHKVSEQAEHLWK